MKSLAVNFLLVAVFAAKVASQSNFILGEAACESSEESTDEDEKVIEECSAEVESTIFSGLERGTISTFTASLRRKRSLVEETSAVEKRISGCFIQCIFRKYSALGEDDLVTRRGLLSVFASDAADRGYYMAAHRIADYCYGKVRDFRDAHRTRPAIGGEVCDLTFDVFNCYVGEMEEYCNGKH